MEAILRHKLILITIGIQLIALPLILLAVKERQETRTRATESTSLSFAPESSATSPISASVGQSFSLDVMVNPGNNLVSLAKIEVLYDPTKVELDPNNKIVVNSEVFPVVVEGPIYSQGRILITLSVGPDSTKVIQTSSKAFTLNFIGVSQTQNATSSISFGPESLIYSIASQDTSNVSVLSATSPAAVEINAAPTNEPTSEPSPTPEQPSPTPVNPSPTPEPSPTPAAPSPTPPQTGSTLLYFTGLKLHGIGKGGDNPNPNSEGTLNPLRPERSLTVEIYNASGTLVSKVEGGIVYGGPQSGTFDGLISLPDTIASGKYTIKIKTPSYLKRQLPGFLNLVKGQTNNAPVAFLIAGDVNNDNSLSILDYNLIMDCYSDLLPAKNCDTTKKDQADLSDDGRVDFDDYNLFLRELSVQRGE
ncbi:MAG: hypothetical protein HYW63_01290 [Candidatus Levybacteria bacterium]|nr:hypothetical protein [Candidatus Levybacteria bacterium]